jgi:hypothetical protein
MEMTSFPHEHENVHITHESDVTNGVAHDSSNGIASNGVAATEARGILDGIAESLRTLAGRNGHDGAPVAIFPRGVDVLEVRMHISRDQDVDLNLRVAGPAMTSGTAA